MYIYILYIYMEVCVCVATTNLRKTASVNQKSSAPHSFGSCNSYTGPQATEIDHPHHPGPKTAISLCTWGLQKGAWEQLLMMGRQKKTWRDGAHLGFWTKTLDMIYRARSEWITHPSQASYKNPQTWTLALNFEPIGSEATCFWRLIASSVPQGFLLRIDGLSQQNLVAVYSSWSIQ